MFDETRVLFMVVVVLALSFDFINGFHDTANSIATAISTKALTPRAAIILASSMNLVGPLAFTGVAETIGGKITNPLNLDNGMLVVTAAMISAITWNLITWYYGIPSSSSHALIGSLTGSVIIAAGLGAVHFSGFSTILGALIFSPLIAFGAGYIFMSLVRAIFKNGNPVKLNRRFRLMQVFSAAWQPSATAPMTRKNHGNHNLRPGDRGFQTTLEVPFWVKLTCAVVMALGTSMGGWKIIKTVGTRIMKLEPASGFSADFARHLSSLWLPCSKCR